MTINVSEALDIDTAIPVTVKRYNPGGYVNGLYQKGGETTFKALASVQQPTDQQLEILEQGEKSADPRLFICNKQLRTTVNKDDFPADQIYYKGNWYKLVANKDWIDFGHNTAIGVRI